MKISESFLVFLIGSIYFIDVVDFMMVMPLGPMFNKDLGIELRYLGIISGSYTLAAAIFGFFISPYLDKFDRKKLILIGLCGLFFSNLLGGISENSITLITSRVIAGIFGGLATSISFAIITDLVAPERRGKAMGKVWGAFSVSSVFGVPFGLKLADMYGWRSPFFVIALLSLIGLFIAWFSLPKMVDHISEKNHHGLHLKKLFNNKNYLLGYASSSLGLMAAFMIIPYIAAYLQYNLSVKVNQIENIFFLGGAISFFAMRIAGYMVDRYSTSFVGFIGISFVIFSIYFSYIRFIEFMPFVIIFAFFMVGMSIRNVANSTISSKIPSSYDRAGFMSITSSLSHLFSSLGSGLASLLISNVDDKLQGMDRVGMVSAVIFLLSVLLLFFLEKGLNKKA